MSPFATELERSRRAGLELIEAKGHEVAEALAALRAASPKRGGS